MKERFQHDLQSCSVYVCGYHPLGKKGPPTVSVLAPPYSPLYTLCGPGPPTVSVLTPPYSPLYTLALCGPGPPTVSVLTPPYSPLYTLPVWSRTTHCVCTHSALLSTVHPPCVVQDHPLCLYSLRPTLHCTPSLCGRGPPTVSVLTPPYSPLYTLPVWSTTTHCVCTHSALLSTVHPRPRPPVLVFVRCSRVTFCRSTRPTPPSPRPLPLLTCLAPRTP